MGEFSDQTERGSYCVICNSANLFAANLSAGGPTLQGNVGGKSTSVSLGGAVSPLENTLSGTTGALALNINGQQKTMIEDLSKFNISRPQDVGAYVENHQPSRSQSQQMGDDVIVMAVDPVFVASAPAEGGLDIETADEATIAWLALVIAQGLNVIDSNSGVEGISAATSGSVDFTLTGTNTIPLAVELIDMLRRGENRQFLREVLKNGTTIGKVWTNSAGNLMVSFRGYAGLRTFLTATNYAATNTKLALVSTAVKNSGNWAGTLKSVTGRVPMISYFIVGAIDIAQWLALPETERDFSDLMATLFVDIAKIAISTVAGTVAAALAIGFGAPVALVVLGGIGAAVLVGVALDAMDNWLGISDRVTELFDEIGQGAVSFFDWVGDAYDAAAQAVEEAVDEALEPARRELRWFERLSPEDQYRALMRAFGG